jgi:membrane protease YdiL (CAAX protease family)
LIAVQPGSWRQSLRWMRTDLLLRLLPFALVVGVVASKWHPSWLGLAWGWVGVQLLFGVAMAGGMFAVAAALQVPLSRRRGVIAVPGGGIDLALQSGYYLVNAPLEEAVFRGLLQGGIGSLIGPLGGIVAGTTSYVLYHRLGGWTWVDMSATVLVGLPLALAFLLLPGPPSLLGVSIAHAGATCGFLGPGPALLRRLGLI